MVFHFLADPQRELQFLEIAKTLAPIVGETVHDLAMKIRRSSGWVARDISDEVATRIAEALEEAGIPCHKIEATPFDVARPDVERIKVLEWSDDGIGVELPFGSETFKWDDLQLLDLNLVGDLGDREERDEQAAAVRLMVESLPAPYAKQRLALLDQRATTEPMLHLFLADPLRVLRVERGTRFPELAHAEPGLPWLDYFLTTAHRVMEILPGDRVSSEADAFWRTKELTCILSPNAEELEHRLGWIKALVRSGAWGIEAWQKP